MTSYNFKFKFKFFKYFSGSLITYNVNLLPFFCSDSILIPFNSGIPGLSNFANCCEICNPKNMPVDFVLGITKFSELLKICLKSSNKEGCMPIPESSTEIFKILRSFTKLSNCNYMCPFICVNLIALHKKLINTCYNLLKSVLKTMGNFSLILI